MEDTIAAISTALGGAISMIRVSGSKAIEKVNNVFKSKDLTKEASHTVHYGYIMDKDEIIDEVLITIMKAPKTYTVEDVVEINCHGGITTTTKILQILLENNIRLAQPGEFTKRAFLNGRIDLIKAESVMDLINVKTQEARKMAINNLKGQVSDKIKELREMLVKILSNIEVNIDYPEYEDIETITTKEIIPQLKHIEKEIKILIENSQKGQLLKDGIKTLIIGKPNVGKSSILNKFLQEEKAIVTDIAGTTRDFVEGTINLNGILLNIIDTAGIRKTKDVVEKIGVDKALSLIDEANLILVVLNGNESLTLEDEFILDKTKNTKSIVVVNKNDLKTKINKTKFKDRIIVDINTKTLDGIKPLEQKITELFQFEKIKGPETNYLSNIRQISLLKEALVSLKNADKGIADKQPIDMVELDIKQSWEKLGEIIGATYNDELLDNLFSKFCVGK